jgi:hypothetical protein
MWKILLILLSAGSALAQPWGPWTIATVPADGDLQHPYVCLRNADVADVFYQTGDTVVHVTVGVETGQIFAGPNPLPMNGSGWTRKLCQVVWSGTGWAALVYDSAAYYNRTLVYCGLDQTQRVCLLDSAHKLDSGEWIFLSDNYNLGLSAGYSGKLFAYWRNVWATASPFHWPEGGVDMKVCEMAGDTLRGCGINLWHNVSGVTWCGGAYSLNNDSAMILLADHSYFVKFCLSWRGGFSPQLEFRNNVPPGANPAGTLYTPGRTLYVVSHPFVDQASCLLRIDNFTSATILRDLSAEPLTGASEPTIGMVWLTRIGPGLALSRIDTTGADYLTPGILYWPINRATIGETATGMSGDGRIAALWIERTAVGTSLKLHSVTWDTPLEISTGSASASPSDYALSAYPNPFNNNLNIRYTLPKAQAVELAIFNVLGQKIETIVSGLQAAGMQQQTWRPNGGSGIYWIVLQGDGVKMVQKAAYLR